jgi:hypothetical protein
MFTATKSLVRRLGGARMLAVPALLLVSGCWTAHASAYVYWSNVKTGTIGRATLEGTEVDQSFITGADASGVAVQGKYIYWADGATSAIGRANLAGGEVDPSFIPGDGQAIGVAVHGSYIYWSNVADRTIGRATLAGAEVNERFIPATGPDGVAVNSSFVYWVNNEPGGFTIGRANLDGSGVDQSLITDPFVPEGVAVDNSHVYWANSFGANTIGSATVDGAHANPSFIAAKEPYGVAVHGKFLYWTNEATNTIGRAGLGGSGVNQSFISGADDPQGVAVNNAVPPWTLELTSSPSPSGVPLAIHALANNPLAGTKYRLKIYGRDKGGKWFLLGQCKTSSCTGSFSPPPPYPATAEVEADVGTASAKPFGKGAIVSRKVKVTASYVPTKPHCKGSECM